MAHILLIDGDAIYLDLISSVLRSDGCDVRAFRDSRAAMDFYCLRQASVDLVLTDAHVAPFSGFSLVKRLGKAGFKPRVVYMCGNETIAGVVRESLGTDAVLAKPFTAMMLRSAVGRALCLQGQQYSTFSGEGSSPNTDHSADSREPGLEVDRRKESRTKCSGMVEVLTIGFRQESFAGMLHDKSTSGLCIHLKRRLRKGASIATAIDSKLIFGRVCYSVPSAEGNKTGIYIQSEISGKTA